MHIRTSVGGHLNREMYLSKLWTWWVPVVVLLCQVVVTTEYMILADCYCVVYFILGMRCWVLAYLVWIVKAVLLLGKNGQLDSGNARCLLNVIVIGVDHSLSSTMTCWFECFGDGGFACLWSLCCTPIVFLHWSWCVCRDCCLWFVCRRFLWSSGLLQRYSCIRLYLEPKRRLVCGRYRQAEI